MKPGAAAQIKIFAKDTDRRTMLEVKSLFPFMKETPAFKDLEIEDSELIRLIYCISLSFYSPGSILCKAGEQGDCFFIILSGGVDLYLPNPVVKIHKVE